jgi:hypothetical protein
MMSKLPPGSRAEQVKFAHDLMRQQELERPRVRLTRTKRRMGVAGLYLAVLATAGLLGALAANAVSGNKAIAILYFLIAVQSLFFVLLTYSVGNLTRGNASLDERERYLRDHATAQAYKILAVVLGSMSFIAVFANEVFHWLPNVNPAVGVTPFLMPFIWFVASLPMAVIAWTLPDPEANSET